MDESNSQSFDEFVDDHQPDIIDDEKPTIPDFDELEEDNDFSCKYCNYKVRSHCKDKKAALLKHMKTHHPEKLDEFIGFDATPILEKKTYSETVMDIDDIEEVGLDEEEYREKLIEDLDILKIKFPNLYNVPSYNEGTSTAKLKRYKKIYVKMIESKISSSVALNVLVASAKLTERATGSLGICDLEGYSSDIIENQEPIMECLQEMIDTGVVDTASVSTEMKLGLILLNIGIKRCEVNRIKKKQESLE